MKSEDRYDSLFQFYGAEADIRQWINLKAQVKAESNFDPLAISSAGAQGLAQFMPATFNEWALKLSIKVPSPYNPEHSIRCQAHYMRWLLDDFKNNWEIAWAAYNFGIGNVMAGKPWPITTKNYISDIQKYLADYGLPLVI